MAENESPKNSVKIPKEEKAAPKAGQEEPVFRHVYRLPPCPSYDVEGTESWLEDMAKKGLWLAEDGLFVGVADFWKREPANIRYRLTAAEKPTGMWAENNGEPQEEEKELNERYGWEYIAQRGGFHIYRSFDENAREPDTDPAVQALALRKVCKRQRGDVFFCVWWGMLYPVLFLRGNVLGLALGLGSPFFLFTLALDLWWFFASCRAAVSLEKLKRQLQNGNALTHRKDWRRKTASYFIAKALKISLSILWVILLADKWSASVMEEGVISLADYTNDPPFATIADFVPEGEYSMDNVFYSNHVKERSDFLAPQMIEWREAAKVKRPDGTFLDGGLMVEYFDTAGTFLAEELTRELLRKDRREKNYEEIPFTIEGADFAAAYYNDVHWPNVILRHGRVVLHAYFYQTGPDEKMPLEEWAQILWKSIS